MMIAERTVRMNETTRKQFIARIKRESATIGMTIPEHLEIKGQDFPLNAFVFETCADGSVPDEYDMTLADIKRHLRSERSDLVEELETADITQERAAKIVETVKAIDRALSQLATPTEETNLEQEMQRATAEQTKRWRAFVNQIQEDTDGSL